VADQQCSDTYILVFPEKINKSIEIKINSMAFYLGPAISLTINCGLA
jgi:hypothetical protein